MLNIFIEEEQNIKPGLYLVPTPIGNLDDITIRAIKILHACNFICCENIRFSSHLLKKYQIQKTLISYNEHSFLHKRKQILSLLEKNKTIGLISNAGTPLLSDPGYKLVQDAIKENYHIAALPGPCAAITSLILSGLACDQFKFLGFLSRKTSKRKNTIGTLRNSNTTTIIYESPQRILSTLHEIQEVSSPERKVCLTREISKMFEETLRCSISDLIITLSKRDKIKGECTIVLGPDKQEEPNIKLIENKILSLLDNYSNKDIVNIVSFQTNIKHKELYKLVLKLRK